MATIADLVVNLTANIASFKSSMNEASKSITELGDQIKETAKHVAEFLAVREVINFTREAAEATLEWSRQVEELANRMGTTAEQASVLAGSAREQGIQVSNLEGMMQRLSQRLATKPKEFATMGVSVRDASGNLLSMNQIMVNVIDRLDEFKAGADRDAAAQAILGRGAGELVANMERYREALDPAAQQRMNELLQAFGLIVDESGIRKSQEWEKAVNDLQIEFLGIQNVIGKEVLPAVKAFNDAIVRAAESGQLQEFVSRFVQIFDVIGSVLKDVAKLWLDYGDAVRSAVDIAIGAIGVLLIATTGPLGIVAGSIALATGAIDDWNTKAKQFNDTSQQMGANAAKLDENFGISGSDWNEKAAGTQHFTEAMAGTHKQGVTLGDQFDKLKLKLEDQLKGQQLLADAASQGTAAMRDADTEIRIQNDLRSLYNEKTHQAVSETSAMGRAIADLERQISAAEATKAAASEITDLKGQVADEQRLAQAYGQGAQAVNLANAAIQTENELRRLGIAETSQQAAQVRELISARQQYATQVAGEKDIETIQRQISQQEQLIIAYQQSTRAGKDLAATFEIQNKLMELGIPLTSATAQKLMELASQESKVKDALDQAQKAAEDHDALIKSLAGDFTQFGENMINAFEQGKNSSKSFKDQVLSDFQTLLKQLEDQLLKSLVFDRIQKGLESILGGGSAAEGGGMGTTGAGGTAAGAGGPGGAGGGGGIAGILGSLAGPVGKMLGGIFGKGGGGTAGALTGADTGTSGAFSTSPGILSSIGGTFGSASAVAGTSNVYGALPDLFSDASGFAKGGIVGLGADEVPIIAHRGEMIVPAKDVGKGTTNITQHFIIQTPNADSFRASSSQMIADAHRAALSAARRS